MKMKLIIVFIMYYYYIQLSTAIYPSKKEFIDAIKEAKLLMNRMDELLSSVKYINDDNESIMELEKIKELTEELTNKSKESLDKFGKVKELYEQFFVLYNI